MLLSESVPEDWTKCKSVCITLAFGLISVSTILLVAMENTQLPKGLIPTRYTKRIKDKPLNGYGRYRASLEKYTVEVF